MSHDFKWAWNRNKNQVKMWPVFEGKVAITSLLTTVATVMIMKNSELSLWTMAAVEIVYVMSLVLVMFSIPVIRVVLYSHLLGVVMVSGAMVAITLENSCYFGFYAVALAFFHFSEYILTSIFNPHTLTTDSFLINHSKEYWVAAIASWLEFWIGLYFFPGLKSLHFISIFGALLVIFGEALRKVSMITAGSNFTHLVQYRKRDDHELVTSGVYSVFRHPSYVGWFYWSVGTQVLLCNPICLLGYAVASWMFFKDRIEEEESSLVLFFGVDYIEYKKRVRTGIPFIDGYPIDKSLLLLQYRTPGTQIDSS